MKILILGGTKFLGRHLVEAALQNNHEVTLFNRGLTDPALYRSIEQLQGDRDGKLDALRGRKWDAVIDTCGYVPRIVRQSARLLAERTNHYTFISSISVYADFSKTGIAEEDETGRVDDGTTEDVKAFYGPLKALCEQEIFEAFGERGLVVRSGLIVGPHDPTDRFTYWPRRFAQGGNVLVPGSPDRPIQYIDVRDLAEWTIRMVEGKENGVYNATLPAHRITMGDLTAACAQVGSPSAHPIWVDDAFLLGHGVNEWTDLPLWLAVRGNWPGFMTVQTDRAIRKGLTFRPLADTVSETLQWCGSRGVDVVFQAGMGRDRETELLKAFAASQN